MQFSNKISFINNKNFYLNLLFLFLVFITIGVPVVSWFGFIVICFAVVIAITNQLKLSFKRLIAAFFITFISIIMQTSFSKNIEEGFIIYPKEGSIFLTQELPTEVNKFLKKTISENYSFNIPSKDHLSRIYENSWSFSADGFWQKKSMSRLVSNINFNNVNDLRIGAYNDVNMNINYNNWSSYGIRLPLVIKYILPEKFFNSDLCFEGLLYLGDEFISHDKFDCIKLNKKSLEIIAFDLNPYPNLKMKIINQDITFQITKLLNLILPLLGALIIIILGKISITYSSFIILGLINYFIYLIDIVYNESLPSNFSPFIFMARGNDGIIFYGYGREILSYLSEGNIFMALRGGVDIFHWMPGMRYFQSISMIFFGETIFGYLLIGILLPFVIYNLLKKFFSNKLSLILVWIFLFFPIFESFGFLQFYYIKLVAKGFGGCLAWTSLFLSISLLMDQKYSNLVKNFSSGFFAGFLLVIAVSCRPNILPMVLVLILGFGIFNYAINNRLKFIGIVFGSLNFFWFSIHNYYYGNEFFLITDSVGNNMDVTPTMWFNFLSSIFSNSLDYNLLINLLNHVSIWINFYEIWLIICILSLILILIYKNIEIKIKIIALSLLVGHSIFLFYPGVPRYSYGIWTLSFIMMVYFLKEQTSFIEYLEKLLKKTKSKFYK